MNVSFKMMGEEAPSLLEEHLEDYQLTYKYPFKGGHVYETDIGSFPEYERLEKLCENLGLEMRVFSNAEWVACIFSNHLHSDNT